MTPDPLTPSPDSPTPRTDERTHIYVLHDGVIWKDMMGDESVDAEFARQLERENAALVKEREEKNTQYENLLRQRGELRATLAERDWEIAELKSALQRSEDEYVAMISHLEGPDCRTFTEPGSHALLLKVFPDKSGFVRSVKKIDPGQECYPCKEWREFRELTNELFSLRAQLAETQTAHGEMLSQKTLAELEARDIRVELSQTQEKLKEAKLAIETAEGRLMVHPADNRSLLDLVSAHLVAEDKLRSEVFTTEAHVSELRNALQRIANMYFGEATAIAKAALSARPNPRKD